jgi:hypothetical protein
MNKYDTKALVKEINDSLPVKANGEKVTSISGKNERAFMRSMINDSEYLPERRDSKGVAYCATPAQDMRDLSADIISKAAKISLEEANKLVENHEFSNANADKLLNITKDFTLGYLETGRKLQIGAGDDYNISIAFKNVKEKENRSPSNNQMVKCPAHRTLRVYGKNPSWNK